MRRDDSDGAAKSSHDMRDLRMHAMRELPVVHVYACGVGQITTMLPRVSLPIRGALRDRHERRLRDAMDAVCCETNNMTRTAKSCGPGAPRLALRFAR